MSTSASKTLNRYKESLLDTTPLYTTYILPEEEPT